MRAYASQPIRPYPGADNERHQESEHHARFVERMKIVLPSLAGVLLCLMLLWPWMADRTSELPFSFLPFDPRTADMSTIANPRFVGSDRSDNPFIVTAVRATNLANEDDWMRLETPKAEMTQASGTWLSLESEVGYVSQEKQLITLDGEVFLYRDDGMEFRTDSAFIDMGENRAFGHMPVTGSGPGFSLTSAEGFAIEEGGVNIRFLGKSSVILPQTQSAPSEPVQP